ncbi:MAG: hypothetical protein B6241_05305 [Spirochaetaceae bacterium 4572_59]|nr:MAG: hypothetical protein B6241_05305 [Spirochaetaceae bacterium 4572_59]
MRKINRGPETSSGHDLHYVYSREEMQRMSRFVDGRSRKSRSFSYQRKILLFDLLFLLIIGGVIVPFIVNRNLSARIDDLTFKMELRKDNTDLFVSLRIINSRSSKNLDEPISLELSIADYDPVFFDEIPPGPGEERVIRYTVRGLKESLPVYCRIKWKDKDIRLNGKTGEFQIKQ